MRNAGKEVFIKFKQLEIERNFVKIICNETRNML